MKISITILFLLLVVLTFAQPSKPYFFASKHCRDSVSANLVSQIEAAVALPLTKDTYGKWTSAFWAMEIMLYKPNGYQQKIPVQLQVIPNTPAAFQRAFFEMLYTLYPKTYTKNVDSIWGQLATDKIKAMVLEYMANSNYFPNIEANNAFRQSPYYPLYFSRWHMPRLLLSKQEFLDTGFLSGQAILCSFQSTDRNKPGYLMIRDSNGKWLTDQNQKPLQYPQLARSISNLPYYLTNGNTPQGLYKIVGLDSSDNQWIGPTTNLQMVMPFENSDKPFFNADTLQALQYQQLLGSLRKYAALNEAFIAGNIGRGEIIAHGTTISPAFYKNQSYYPLTPSLGCLCSLEIWNDEGILVESAQQKWIDTFRNLKQMLAYIIVAEIADL